MNQSSDNGTVAFYLVQSANNLMKSCRNACSQSTVAGVWPLWSSACGVAVMGSVSVPPSKRATSGAVVHLNSGPSWPGHSSIACVEALALRSDHLGVEATQHTGDEIFSAE